MKKNFWSEEKGQGLLEMAIVLPLLILLLFGIMEMARVGHAYVTLSNAARSGARVASIGGLTSEIKTAVYEAAPGLDSEKLEVIVTPSEGSRISGGEVKVVVKYPVTLIAPVIEGIIPNPVVVGTSLTMRIE